MVCGKNNEIKFANKEQYLNYLAIEMLNVYGNVNPLEEEILHVETLLNNCCGYLHYLAVKFLKVMGKNNPTKQQINQIGSLIVNHSKKYFHELNIQNKTRKSKINYLRKTNKIV